MALAVRGAGPGAGAGARESTLYALIQGSTFTAGGLEVAMQREELKIVHEGKYSKFVDRIQHVCFHGPSALARGQQILYVTERAVFELTSEGLRLIEIAQGIDLQTQILDLMAFRPTMADEIRNIRMPGI